MSVEHTAKARSERPAIYPPRAPVPDDRLAWDVPFPDYAPPYFVAAVVLTNDELQNPHGWADPEDLQLVKRQLRSHEGEVRRDDRGRPLNPAGRTGIAGRGLLGRWGSNFAADAIVTRPTGSHVFEMIAIQRKDSGEWAIPGGMHDPGEDTTRTAQRELEEETGIILDLNHATQLYRGYIDDRRNTDNAWIETTAFLLHLNREDGAAHKPKGGDDAARAQWIAITDETLASFYASHGDLIRMALAQLGR